MPIGSLSVCQCPVSIQTQSLALRALRKRKPQETQALAFASSQSWLPLLRPSIPIGWRLRLLREIFVYATQAIAFEWKPGFSLADMLYDTSEDCLRCVVTVAVNHGPNSV